MFKFNYTINSEDYFLFNEHHALSSPEGKKNLLMHKLIMPILCTIIILVFFFADASWGLIKLEIVALFILSCVWIGFSKKIMCRSLRKNIKKINKSGRLPYSETGTLTFDDTSIYDSGLAGESKIDYPLVEKIHVTQQAVYIYFSSLQAFILPISCFSGNAELQDFLTFLQSKTNKNLTSF